MARIPMKWDPQKGVVVVVDPPEGKRIVDVKTAVDFVGHAAWHDAELDPPPEDIDVLLIVDGAEGHTYAIGGYSPEMYKNNKHITPGWYIDGVEEYGGLPEAGDYKIKVFYWMMLPPMPKTGDNVIVHSEWRRRT